MSKELTIENTSLPKGWKILPFGDVCEISGGSQPPKPTFIYEPKEGYIRLVQVRDYRTDNFITYIPKEKAKKFCNKTDIMIGRYGPPIFGIFRGLEGAYNVALMKAIPNKELLNQEYLYWFLKTDSLVKFVEKSSKRAAGQDGVRKEVLYTYPTPIPPISQQKQIIVTLDKAFAAIDIAKANAEQNLQNAKELFESISLQKFTDGINIKKWKLEKIEKYSQVVVGYVGSISKEYTNDENDVLLLSTKNISDEGISLKKLTRINHTFHNKQKKSQLLPGDILVARHGKSGQAAVIPDSMKAAHALNVIIIKKSETILSEYIAFLLNSGVLSKIQDSKGGSVQEIINTSVIKKLIIPVPILQHQGKIIEELNKVSKKAKKLEAIYTQKIADLEEMKKSVLQKAFSGQLNTIN